ncbi:alcohol dehydrogenase [Reticulomyxa filosa]|uniref:Probable quinone oxidoreductase n=1 Tax=Reticulomyxa filosa TaxID=46433 RepID=X6MKC7_RETFI|nr:alcohol dehydrogenase [Reticulomyxa filosa]|eukprot:ETO14458.1 alcohol dehydrogenase [Reticulomyxa filosa]
MKKIRPQFVFSNSAEHPNKENTIEKDMATDESSNKRVLITVDEKDRGGPEKLKVTLGEIPVPSNSQVLIQVKACGVNFIDVYHRTGLYPGITEIGKEGAGVILAVGKQVEQFKVGQNTKELMVIPEPLLKTHKEKGYIYAAAIPLQGLTAHYLCRSVYDVGPNDTVLVHAGAGGTGGLLIQICKKILKCKCVITTVGSDDKAKVALQSGADYVINYEKEDFYEKVNLFTKGKGCNVVYDGVGKATWEKSLKCVSPLGRVVYFGNSSGKIPPIDPLELTKQGSVTLVRPNLAHFIATPEALQARAKELFEWIESQQLQIRIGAAIPLKNAAKAHQLIESRDTTGKIVLIP